MEKQKVSEAIEALLADDEARITSRDGDILEEISTKAWEQEKIQAELIAALLTFIGDINNGYVCAHEDLDPSFSTERYEKLIDKAEEVNKK